MEYPGTFEQFISPADISRYQLTMLNRQMEYVKASSYFYRSHLDGISKLISLGDLGALPFTTAEDIVHQGAKMVCLPGSAVKRIVTLQTSGTSKAPKRLYFSAADIERTVQFFAVGMRYLCGKGDSVMICMPGISQDSIGYLLAQGLERIGARPYIYGPVNDYEEAAAYCRDIKPHTIVGIPLQIRRLALTEPNLRPANILLSADYPADSLCNLVKKIWRCDIFNHYGLTESGLGCAVECPGHQGQHIRHDELLMEIVEPGGSRVLPAGVWGEIVITTLRREAMPLIRYRTGDWGRLLKRVCACGSELPRLDKVQGRICELDRPLNIYRLDEALLSCEDILDYTAESDGKVLKLIIKAKGTEAYKKAARILNVAFPDIEIIVESGEGFTTRGTIKRSIARR